jgi:hypothetical protein
VFENWFVLALYALPNTAWHDKLVSLVERMLELHKRSPRLPQEKESLQREIEPAADRMIDRLASPFGDDVPQGDDIWVERGRD